MDLKSICIILLLLVLALPASGENATKVEANASSDWMKVLNPDDYSLQAADLPDPFVYMDGYTKVDKCDDKSRACAPFTVDSNGSQQKHAYLMITESIALKAPNSKYAGSDGIIYYCIELGVSVYETPDLAREVVKSKIKYQPQYFPPYPHNGFKDSKAEYSTDDGGLIQYKNIIGGMTWHGDDNSPYGPILMKIWLDKIAHAKSAPDKPDLHLQSDRIYLSSPYLTSPSNSDFLPREPAADKQAVAVKVENRGSVVAKNVKLQLYRVLDDKPEPLGDPVSVGDISAGQVKNASAFWDLGGQNVEGAVLQARAYVPGEKDAFEEDNNASINVNIYYAYNGLRAYSWFNDTYRFVNYGFKDRETEEIAEGLLSTVAGNMNADALPSVLQRLFFPSTYKRFQNYATLSTNMGAGGHCYGMSATSALYFEDPSLKPLPKSVSDMTLEEASTNINIYHRAQMLPLWESILGDKLAFKRDESPAKCRQTILDSLKNKRLPVIIEFFGDIGGHAVLAYKLIEVEGRGPVVYVYDSNSPEANVKPSMPITQITLQPSQDYWRYPTYMGYAWAYPHNISAHKVFREIPLKEVNDLVPYLKKAVYEMMATLKKANAFMAVLKCPADAVFIDDQGRRVGVVDGHVVNEIPGAEVQSQGEVEIYQLPGEKKYVMTIVGTGSGEASFDVIRPDGVSAGLVSFQKMPVTGGTKITGVLDTGGAVETLQAGAEVIQPTLKGFVDLTDLGTGVESTEVTTEPVTSPPKTVPTNKSSESSSGKVASPEGAEYNIIDYATCKDVVDNKPVDRTDAFSTMDERVYQVINIAPHYRSHTVENKWFSPDGSLYKSGQYTSEDQQYEEGLTYWGWIAIKGHNAENMPGIWKVETYIDGQYVITQQFVIKPASGQPI